MNKIILVVLGIGSFFDGWKGQAGGPAKRDADDGFIRGPEVGRVTRKTRDAVFGAFRRSKDE